MSNPTKPEMSASAGSQLVVDHAFATSGATDASVFREGGKTYLVVAQSLSADIRFRTESKVYTLDVEG